MNLACDDLGRGTPVVCLPPFSLDRSVMAAALEPVLGRRPGLRRLYVDLPGHGESPAGPATSEHVLATVSAFVQAHLGGAPALVAGWSYGGYIAGALSRRQPAAVAGLLLICAGVRDHDRDLPGPPAEPAPEHWLDEVPADLRAHLATAIGHRTAQTAARVASVLAGSLPGDGAYQQRLSLLFNLLLSCWFLAAWRSCQRRGGWRAGGFSSQAGGPDLAFRVSVRP